MTGMVPEDVYELTGVADPRLSPDGTTVAYVVGAVDKDANEYRAAIWLAAADGSAPPRRFTSGEKADADPRWSPDGTQLAFTSNRADKASQLYVMPVAGGEPRKLTSLKEDVTQAVVVAGRHAHRLRRARARRRLRGRGRQEARGRAASRACSTSSTASAGRPTGRSTSSSCRPTARPSRCSSRTATTKTTRRAGRRTARTIAFVSARHPDWDLEMVNDVYLVDAAGGEPRRLTQGGGSIGGVSWAPDGSRLAVERYAGVFDDPRHTQIALVDPASGEFTPAHRVARPQLHARTRACASRSGTATTSSSSSRTTAACTSTACAADGSGEPRLRRRRRARRDRARRGRRPARVHGRASRRG